jgi:MerR family transcriptional regulator, repressor of the yfmOP operon
VEHDLLRIGDVAELTELTQRAIRYYEEYGLLRPAERRTGANRRYDQDDLERLRLIKRLREDVGLSLAEIATYLEVEDLRRELKSEYHAAVDPAAQLAVLERAEPVVRRRIAMLERKLVLVTALRAEDEARLERIAVLRQGPRGSQAPQGSQAAQGSHLTPLAPLSSRGEGGKIRGRTEAHSV